MCVPNGAARQGISAVTVRLRLLSCPPEWADASINRTKRCALVHHGRALGISASSVEGGAINVRSTRLALCFFGVVSDTWSQAVSTSQISGAVQDASGAAIASAQIRLMQTETGQVRATTTGADGSYLFPNLVIGPYRMEVSKEGFATYVDTGIVLNVILFEVTQKGKKVPSVGQLTKSGYLCTKIDAGAHSAPITLQGKDGKQYIVATATGPGFLGDRSRADTVIAYALP